MNNVAGPGYKSGDRVVGLAWWATGKHGKVIEPSLRGDKVLVAFDDHGPATRVSVTWIRPETAEETAQCITEASVREWRERKPETAHAVVVEGVAGTVDHVMLCVFTPRQMREAAIELMRVADWRASKPEIPGEEGGKPR